MSRHANRSGYRFCNGCDVEYPLSDEFFPRDKNRKHGLGYQCRPCERRKIKPSRPNRWAAMTPAQRARRKRLQQVYSQGEGRAVFKVGAYRAFDKQRGFTCDLTADWLRENILGKPCFYCDDAATGCDRIDNRAGHMMANVVPCCADCNSARMDRFTHEEMVLLGQTIRIIKERRYAVAS